MKFWLHKLVNDVTQMNLHITDRDFRVASEAMNLREKTVHYNNNIKRTMFPTSNRLRLQKGKLGKLV